MITPRLDMIYRNIGFAHTVADVGTDHAYIPIRLAENGINVIATDIKKGPLDMAAANIKRHFDTEQIGSENLSTTQPTDAEQAFLAKNNIDLRLGAGLAPLKCGEADTIIVAGMGGEMIIKILSAHEKTARSSRLILQPMNSQYELRHFLLGNSYKIIHEDIAVEGIKVYNLIVAENGEQNTPEKEIDFHLPPSLYEHSCFPQLLAKKKREFTRIYNGLLSGNSQNEQEILKYKTLLSQIEKIEGETL